MYYTSKAALWRWIGSFWYIVWCWDLLAKDCVTQMSRMTLSINKLITTLVFLKGQLSKLIKNLLFLKVETRNFDRDLSFESAKRSSPIGVSISSQNERIPGCHRMPPDATGYPRKRDTACSKQPPGLAPEVKMTVV